MHKSARRTSRGVAFLVALLFAPPVVNIVIRDYWLEHREGSDLAESEAEELRRLRIELANLRQRFEREGRESSILAAWDSSYDPVLARVLRLGDAAPQRQSFWIVLQKNIGGPEDFVVVSDGALVGRVTKFLPGDSIALVQSILDRHFIVRFRYGDSWGFLRGTGRTDRATGRPILQVELKGQPEIPFQEGTPVFTDGDGLFPPDILIGHVSPASLADSEAFHVVADGRPDVLRDVVVLKDSRIDGSLVNDK